MSDMSNGAKDPTSPPQDMIFDDPKIEEDDLQAGEKPVQYRKI